MNGIEQQAILIQSLFYFTYNKICCGHLDIIFESNRKLHLEDKVLKLDMIEGLIRSVVYTRESHFLEFHFLSS